MVSAGAANAQDVKSFLYEGSIDNQLVSFYVTVQGNPCGGDKDLCLGIYKYKTKDRWIQLGIATDHKGHFSLTEYGFTGVMVLQKTGAGMDGIWISPDGKKQLKVKLNIKTFTTKEKEKLDEALEKTNYENNDC
jgi:hypothetical protein